MEIRSDRPGLWEKERQLEKMNQGEINEYWGGY
jgi:hypothetical protein